MEIKKATEKDIDNLMTIRLEMLRVCQILMSMMNLLSKIAVRTLLKEIRLIFFV